MGLFRVFLLQSYKWIGLGWMGWDWDLCVGLLYEHRFAVLIIKRVHLVSVQISGTDLVSICWSSTLGTTDMNSILDISHLRT